MCYWLLSDLSALAHTHILLLSLYECFSFILFIFIFGGKHQVNDTYYMQGVGGGELLRQSFPLGNITVHCKCGSSKACKRDWGIQYNVA